MGYVAQVQHYMDILGLNQAVIVAVAGMTWYEHFVARDEFEIENQRIKAKAFMEAIFSDQKPAWDGSESTYEAVRHQHPDIVDEEVEMTELEEGEMPIIAEDENGDEPEEEEEGDKDVEMKEDGGNGDDEKGTTIFLRVVRVFAIKFTPSTYPLSNLKHPHNR